MQFALYDSNSSLDCGVRIFAFALFKWKDTKRLNCYLGLCSLSRRKLTWSFQYRPEFCGDTVLLIWGVLVRVVFNRSARVGGLFFAFCLLLTSYVLRVEIWERNKIVLGISATTLLINLGACIYCVFYLAFLETQRLNQV